MPSQTLPKPPTTIIVASQRKQNIACDSCRAKKIRCLRATKSEICQQCTTKELACTSEYIDSLKSAPEAKGRIGSRKTPTTTSALVNDTESHEAPAPGKRKRRKTTSPSQSSSTSLLPTPQGSTGELPLYSGVSYPPDMPLSTYGVGVGEAESSAMASRRESLEQSIYGSAQLAHPSLCPSAYDTSLSLGLATTPKTARDKQLDLLRYLFSPYPLLTPQYGYTDSASIAPHEISEYLWEEDGGRVWLEQPSESHLSLDDALILRKLAEELLEQYLSIVPLRLPLHSPTDIRSRFLSPDTDPSGPLPDALLAVILAWGARLSDDPILMQDAEECSLTGSEKNRRGSRITRLLVIRAREVMESNKTFRIASLENAQALFLLEGVLGQAIVGSKRNQGFYSDCAIRYLRAINQDSSSDLTTGDMSKAYIESTLLWRALAVSDTIRSLTCRTKPALDDDDYITHLSDTQDKVDALAQILSTWSDEQVTQRTASYKAIWLSSQARYATLCRQLYQSLFSPRAMRGGRQSSLRDIVQSLESWRNTFLPLVGVPVEWPEDGDFSYVVMASAADIMYHYLWVVLDRALDEKGLREEDREEGSESVLGRVRNEGEHAALRIAALVAVLTENNYLRLDPLIIYHAIYEAGQYLARRGRDECLACIAGLGQYAQTFPAASERSEELRELYLSRRTTSVGSNSARNVSRTTTASTSTLASADTMSAMGDSSLSLVSSAANLATTTTPLSLNASSHSGLNSTSMPELPYTTSLELPTFPTWPSEQVPSLALSHDPRCQIPQFDWLE